MAIENSQETFTKLNFWGVPGEQRDLLTQLANQLDGEVCHYQLNEDQVDQVLEEKAYCGGEISNELYDLIEDYTEGHNQDIPISVFFYGDQRKEKAERLSKEFQNVGKVLNVESEELPILDWHREWQMRVSPSVINSELTVFPSLELAENSESRYKLIINPGMGFGTGEHETTSDCLKALYRLHREGKLEDKFRALDFGAGSGILGISAMKMANLAVDFCDIDSEALDNCLGNLKLNFFPNDESFDFADNKAGESIELIKRDRFQFKKSYDLIFANILANILIEESKSLIESLRAGGHLILSGLLKEQMENVLEVYEGEKTGLSVEQTWISKDWATILLRKNL